MMLYLILFYLYVILLFNIVTTNCMHNKNCTLIATPKWHYHFDGSMWKSKYLAYISKHYYFILYNEVNQAHMHTTQPVNKRSIN